MPAPTPHRYFNIQNFQIGTAGFSSIRRVSFRQSFTHLSSAGDADAAESFQARGCERVSVAIDLEDGVQAQAIINAAVGDITFVGQTSAGGTTKTVTIKNFEAFDRGGDDAFDKIAAEQVTGHAFDPGGTGPIVTEAATA